MFDEWAGRCRKLDSIKCVGRAKMRQFDHLVLRSKRRLSTRLNVKIITFHREFANEFTVKHFHPRSLTLTP